MYIVCLSHRYHYLFAAAAADAAGDLTMVIFRRDNLYLQHTQHIQRLPTYH